MVNGISNLYKYLGGGGGGGQQYAPYDRSRKKY